MSTGKKQYERMTTIKPILTSDYFEKAGEAWIRDFAEKTLKKLPDKSVLSDINPFDNIGSITLGSWMAWRNLGTVGYRRALWLLSNSGKRDLVGVYSYRKRGRKKVEFGVLLLPQHELRILRYQSYEVLFFLNSQFIGKLCCTWGLKFGSVKGQIIYDDKIFGEVRTGVIGWTAGQEKTIDIKLSDGNPLLVVVNPKRLKASFTEVMQNVNKFESDAILNDVPHPETTPIFPQTSGSIIGNMPLEQRALLLGVTVWLSGVNRA